MEYCLWPIDTVAMAISYKACAGGVSSPCVNARQFAGVATILAAEKLRSGGFSGSGKAEA